MKTIRIKNGVARLKPKEVKAPTTPMSPLAAFNDFRGQDRPSDAGWPINPFPKWLQEPPTQSTLALQYEGMAIIDKLRYLETRLTDAEYTTQREQLLERFTALEIAYYGQKRTDSTYNVLKQSRPGVIYPRDLAPEPFTPKPDPISKFKKYMAMFRGRKP